MLGLISFWLCGFIPLNIQGLVRNIERFDVKTVSDDKIRNSIIFLSSSIFCYIILALSNFNIYLLLLRGYYGDGFDLIESSSLSSIQGLIYNNVIRPIPIFFFTLFFYQVKSGKRGKNNITIALLFILAIIFVSPTALPRFQIAALYMPICIMLFSGFMVGVFRMPIILIVILLFVFPFLDKFRYFNPDTFDLSLDFTFLGAGHFDSYQNFVHAVSIDYITFGYQLLGPLGFFVSRDLWPDKPIGSGSQMAINTGLNFTNISMPYIGEGFVNYGLLGVVLFMGFLGVLLSSLDKTYWVLRNSKNSSIYIPFYYTILGMVFFLMRGDLLSSFAYTVGILISFISTAYLLKIICIKTY